MKSKRKIAYITTGILILLVVLCIYTCKSSYYPAGNDATMVINSKADNYEIKQLNGALAFEPGAKATAGFIFYPGGMVEYTAYSSLMAACADSGILCILVKMPFNLAIFNQDAAADFRAMYPEIEAWYLGGHSLGGAMAAYHMEDHWEDYKGLILLAAYSTKDLSNTTLNFLSIYGTEDQVLNRQQYTACLNNIKNCTEYVIEGGCHAYFGDYGFQDGDGTPSITQKEQNAITAQHIIDFINE